MYIGVCRHRQTGGASRALRQGKKASAEVLATLQLVAACPILVHAYEPTRMFVFVCASGPAHAHVRLTALQELALTGCLVGSTEWSSICRQVSR